MTMIYHRNDHTGRVDEIKPVDERPIFKYRLGRDGETFMVENAIGLWIKAKEGDEIGIIVDGKMQLQTVTKEDVDRGFMSWKGYGKGEVEHFHEGIYVKYPIFIAPRTRYSVGDIYQLSISVVAKDGERW